MRRIVVLRLLVSLLLIFTILIVFFAFIYYSRTKPGQYSDIEKDCVEFVVHKKNLCFTNLNTNLEMVIIDPNKFGLFLESITQGLKDPAIIQKNNIKLTLINEQIPNPNHTEYILGSEDPTVQAYLSIDENGVIVYFWLNEELINNENSFSHVSAIISRLSVLGLVMSGLNQDFDIVSRQINEKIYNENLVFLELRK